MQKVIIMSNFKQNQKVIHSVKVKNSNDETLLYEKKKQKKEVKVDKSPLNSVLNKFVLNSPDFGKTKINFTKQGALSKAEN